MISVIHDISPIRLTKFSKNSIKQQLAWNNLSSECRQTINQQLMTIQYGLCAYCEETIHKTNNNHIEHIKPKSQYPAHTFSYTNLILSCDKQNTCGQFKKNTFDENLFISPTEINDVAYFLYVIDGRIIVPDKLNDLQKQQSKYTINTLNLNCNKLVRDRQAVIKTIVKTLESLENQDQIKFINLQLSVEKNSYYNQPFINAIKQFINQFTYGSS